MPVLDPKREAAAAAYVANGGNQLDAYRTAHPESKANKRSMAVAASRMFSEPNMQLRIAELHAGVERVAADTGQILLTQEQHMRKLEELRDNAEARGQLSAAITAEVKRGELRRFYVKQVETGEAGEFARMNDDELRQHIAAEARELGITPAKKLAGQTHH